MLKIEGLTKRYGKLVALDNVNINLEDGKVAVLLGLNGAGKSTLMKSIIGFLKYDGRITFNGLENSLPAVRALIGYIPELPSLYPNLTVNEHMEFVARLYKLENYKDRIDMLLDRFELFDKREKFGDELSKGMQQKLSICLGLLPDPSLILMDEPMIGLDPYAIKEIKMMIEEMANEGKSILISTHIIESVDMLWDKAIILEKGKIKADITKAELDKETHSLEDLFFLVTKESKENVKE